MAASGWREVEVGVPPSLGRLTPLDPSPPHLALLSCRKKENTYRQGDSDPLQLALVA